MVEKKMKDEKMTWWCRIFGHKYVTCIATKDGSGNVRIMSQKKPFCKLCGEKI